MWARRTESELVLPPRHAFVFRAALGCVSDGVGWEEEEPRWESGLSVFDRLTQGQQQAALLTIARALLDGRVPAPAVTAVLAAAVSATYDMLLALIEIEVISEDGSTDLRREVLAAVEEMDYWTQVNEGLAPGQAAAEPPAPRCADLDEWAHLVNALRDQVLEDYDFEMEDQLVDLNPMAARAVKRFLDIDGDYFIAVPEDPSPKRLAGIRQELTALLRGEEPADSPGSP